MSGVSALKYFHAIGSSVCLCISVSGEDVAVGITMIAKAEK